ncbi:MAG: 2-oxoacid:acceptor oxidoreductase subunit alpha, partial [Myxococcales bacterium]|nr:2-oxoacid:acceptor oxidoreductase subunit alpha [Myxococcales bacterium]
RCKNMWTLGLLYWLFDRDREPTVQWLERKFSSRPVVAAANISALHAGHVYAESAELPSDVHPFEVDKARLEPGLYRNIDGNTATAWGVVTGAKLAGLPVFYGSYPITPATSILHALAKMKEFGVTTFQAEDEIAAVASSIGASFGGAIGVTGTSGPGVALKTEAIGLAIATELPLVIINVQRGGPSTGMPTKTEQSDLLQAVWGRNGDAPLPVLAASSPSDCFTMAIEAVRLAIKYMTPVMLLTDGYLANGAEPWRVPQVSEMTPFPTSFHQETEGFHPFLRDPETLARIWPIPGTPGLMHRIGGIERDHDSGHISYEPENHHRMTKIRAAKVEGIANDLPVATLEQGEAEGDLLAVGWGSTHGSISQAVRKLREQGKKVSHLHLRNLWPLPRGVGEILAGFRHVMVPEMNNGMLDKMLRAEFLVDAVGFNKISGQPFYIDDLADEIQRRLDALEGGK